MKDFICLTYGVFFLNVFLGAGCSELAEKFAKPAGEFTNRLPGKYELISANLRATVIQSTASGEGIVVAPHIASINCNSNIVVGEVITTRFSNPALGTRPGYFILDVASGKVEHGLTYDEFENHLKKYSVKDIILHKPSGEFRGDL
jgi:hypothetical protein